jgi:chromosome segregation ATPase
VSDDYGPAFWARRAVALADELTAAAARIAELEAELAAAKEQDAQTQASCEKVWSLFYAERAHCGVLEGELENAKERIVTLEEEIERLDRYYGGLCV